MLRRDLTCAVHMVGGDEFRVFKQEFQQFLKFQGLEGSNLAPDPYDAVINVYCISTPPSLPPSLQDSPVHVLPHFKISIHIANPQNSPSENLPQCTISQSKTISCVSNQVINIHDSYAPQSPQIAIALSRHPSQPSQLTLAVFFCFFQNLDTIEFQPLGA